MHRAVGLHPGRARARGIRRRAHRGRAVRRRRTRSTAPTTRSTRRWRAAGVSLAVRAHRRHRRAAQGLPTIVAAVGEVCAHRIPTSRSSSSGRAGWGEVPRARRPFVRVLGATAVGGRRRAVPARRCVLHRVAATKGSGSPRSRRWRAARRPSRRRARRSKSRARRRACCSRPATSTPVPTSSSPRARRRAICASSSAPRAGPAPPSSPGSARPRPTPTRTNAPGARAAFVDSPRARAPRRLRGSGAPGRRRRVHVALAQGLARRTDVDLHLCARRNDTERWDALAARRDGARGLPRPAAGRLVWEQPARAALARRVAPRRVARPALHDAACASTSRPSSRSTT